MPPGIHVRTLQAGDAGRVGLVRERNRAMLRLAARLGFRIAHDEDPGYMRVERALIGL